MYEDWMSHRDKVVQPEESRENGCEALTEANMDFAFFDSLNPQQAHEFLAAFISAEKPATERMAEAARQQGIPADYSIPTLPNVVRWALDNVRTVPKAPDKKLPDWITSTDAYKTSLFEFTDETKPVVLRTAYYFGESFVRTFDKLRWAVGNPEAAQRNMPVVAGFGGEIELAPILVVENMFRRALRGKAEPDAFERAVSRWAEYIAH